MNTITNCSNLSISKVGAPKRGQGAARLAKCSVPAAIITTGLFLGMQALVQAEGFEAPVLETRTVAAFIAEPDAPFETGVRPPVDQIPPAIAPPAAPPLVSALATITLPAISLKGAVPDVSGLTRVKAISTAPIAIDPRSVKPIRPPVPSYPHKAIINGIEGTCDVRMDVTAQGRPFNVHATCTDAIFSQEAQRAVSRVEFLPKIERGRAVERRNVIYPLEFKLEQ